MIKHTFVDCELEIRRTALTRQWVKPFSGTEGPHQNVYVSDKVLEPWKTLTGCWQLRNLT
jgi:hypothetical protein